MNQTPIEVAAVVFTILMLIGFLGYYNGWFSFFMRILQEAALSDWGG